MLERVISERHPDGKIKSYIVLFNGKPIPEGYKHCAGHDDILPLEAFSQHGNKCKECANAASRKHHARRALDADWRARRNQKQKEHGLEKKQAAIHLLGGKCADCSGTFHPAVFDFHHENPDEKEYNLGDIIRRKRKPETIAKELAKCVLLCANCHRIRHFGGGNQ